MCETCVIQEPCTQRPPGLVYALLLKMIKALYFITFNDIFPLLFEQMNPHIYFEWKLCNSLPPVVSQGFYHLIEGSGVQVVGGLGEWPPLVQSVCGLRVTWRKTWLPLHEPGATSLSSFLRRKGNFFKAVIFWQSPPPAFTCGCIAMF